MVQMLGSPTVLPMARSLGLSLARMLVLWKVLRSGLLLVQRMVLQLEIVSAEVWDWSTA
jgi:hypothetical protein